MMYVKLRNSHDAFFGAAASFVLPPKNVANAMPSTKHFLEVRHINGNVVTLPLMPSSRMPFFAPGSFILRCRCTSFHVPRLNVPALPSRHTCVPFVVCWTTLANAGPSTLSRICRSSFPPHTWSGT